MRVLALTNIGEILRTKGKLKERADKAGATAEVVAQITKLTKRRWQPLPADNSALAWQALVKSCLVEIIDVPPPQHQLLPRDIRFNPLSDVYVLNLELTYECLLSCQHCSQIKFRREQNSPDLSTEEVKNLIDQASFMGLRAVNMTGGEPLRYRLDILELIAYAKQQGVYVRLNTNGWWGDKTDFVVGGERFATAADFVRRLRDTGVTLLVTSLDGLENTHDQRRGLTGLYQSVISAIKASMNAFLLPRVLATNVLVEERDELVRVIKNDTGLGLDLKLPNKGIDRPVFWGLGFKDAVDLGGEAADLPLNPPSIVYDENLLADSRLLCQGLGFIHPTIIHVSPVGQLRSCNHAVGFGNLGNVRQKSLLDLLNVFPADAVSQVFLDQALHIGSSRMTQAAERLFLAKAYKSFTHPCTALVVLAHLIQAEAYFKAQRQTDPLEEDIGQFNLAVARSLNLNI